MTNKALIVIDIQNNITKNYKDIIDNLNMAINMAVKKIFMLSYKCGMKSLLKWKKPSGF